MCLCPSRPPTWLPVCDTVVALVRGLGLRRMVAVVKRAGGQLRQSLRESGLEGAVGAPSTGSHAVTVTTLEIAALHQAICELLLPEVVPVDFSAFAGLLQVG
jgi:hypothetical protein